MPLSATEIRTPDLVSWSTLEGIGGWTRLLVGNGASLAVSSRFAYDSLFTVASDTTAKDHLTAEDLRLFTSFSTVNFELVLSALATSARVAAALAHDQSRMQARYASIRRALVHAVHRHHLAWHHFRDAARAAIAAELSKFRFVYSTNYDLLLYWSMMQGSEVATFKDLFWGGRFDPENTEIWAQNTSTVVFYLHGGLHLYTTVDGSTCKRTASFGTNLLDAFSNGATDEAGPLFIAEGDGSDKLAAIYRSPYLLHAYTQLKETRGDLVVFGLSFGDSDQHLVAAIKKSAPKKIAVALRPGPPDEVVYAKARLKSFFPSHSLYFFDSTTYALGVPELRCDTLP